MPKKPLNGENRARQMLAQETARIIVEQGVRNYGAAKIKAAARLGMTTRGALPRNAEIESAISEYLQLFHGDWHANFLSAMRHSALSAMGLLSPFSPRLVGPVLNGTADENSAVNLHVFSDCAETVATRLSDLNVIYRPYERRLKSSRNRNSAVGVFTGFEFKRDETIIEATVFPVDGIRQAPISPIDGRPMKRADFKTVQGLIAR